MKFNGESEKHKTPLAFKTRFDQITIMSMGMGMGRELISSVFCIQFFNM